MNKVSGKMKCYQHFKQSQSLCISKALPFQSSAGRVFGCGALETGTFFFFFLSLPIDLTWESRWEDGPSPASKPHACFPIGCVSQSEAPLEEFGRRGEHGRAFRFLWLSRCCCASSLIWRHRPCRLTMVRSHDFSALRWCENHPHWVETVLPILNCDLFPGLRYAEWCSLTTPGSSSPVSHVIPGSTTNTLKINSGPRQLFWISLSVQWSINYMR